MIEVPKIVRDATNWPVEVPCWERIIGDATKAIIWCGNGHLATTSAQHTIDPEGKVSPSVVCPREGCTWHEWVKLVGWTDDPE